MRKLHWKTAAGIKYLQLLQQAMPLCITHYTIEYKLPGSRWREKGDVLLQEIRKRQREPANIQVHKYKWLSHERFTHLQFFYCLKWIWKTHSNAFVCDSEDVTTAPCKIFLSNNYLMLTSINSKWIRDEHHRADTYLEQPQNHDS